MSPRKTSDGEWLTRKERIDPKLDAAGWRLLPAGATRRTEEEPTEHGPADYALWLDGQIVGVVEAKKLTVGPQNVLTQAERYARGLRGGAHNHLGLRAPFLYSTIGEVIWFHDIRHPLARSRRVSAFHTPAALREMLDRDFDAACSGLQDDPNEHPRLRPYQRKANAAMEKAIAERKRHMLVAMATGKTFTTVNQVYRLMKARVARRVLFLLSTVCYLPLPRGWTWVALGAGVWNCGLGKQLGRRTVWPFYKQRLTPERALSYADCR